jgi:dUTPase
MITLYVCAVNVGDRVAQLILEKIQVADVLEVDDLDETCVFTQRVILMHIPLPHSTRGGAGFGSTGVSVGVSAVVSAGAPTTSAKIDT